MIKVLYQGCEGTLNITTEHVEFRPEGDKCGFKATTVHHPRIDIRGDDNVISVRGYAAAKKPQETLFNYDTHKFTIIGDDKYVVELVKAILCLTDVFTNPSNHDVVLLVKHALQLINKRPTYVKLASDELKIAAARRQYSKMSV